MSALCEGKKFAFLGVGNMAGAIIRGMDGAGIPRGAVRLFDRDVSKYEPYDGGYVKTSSACEAVSDADYVFLAVKPQGFSVPLAELRDGGASLDGKVVVSIVAGVPIERICAALGRETACVRTMPNTPLLVGRGVTALTRNALVSDSDFENIKAVFRASGSVTELPEDKLNAVISATSSAPAYVYLFIKAITDSAAAQGLNGADMLPLVCDMVDGSAEMLRSTGKTPAELIRMVTSPGGTTERAMKVLNESDFTGIIDRAMRACTERAEELSRS